MNPADDMALVARAQAGDLNALERLLAALEPPLRRYLARLVGAQADDVVQETFLRMWRNLGWLRDPELLRAWVYRIATREAQRVMERDRKREAARADVALLDTLPAELSDPAARLDVEACLPRLSPRARIVVAAHYLEGLSLEEVAAIVGAPLGTVKSRLASGLAQLRTMLGERR